MRKVKPFGTSAGVFLACVLILCVAGCASRGDLDSMSRSLEGRVSNVQVDVVKVRKLAEGSEESANFLRQKTAEIDANMIELRDSVQQMRGATEDTSMRITSLETGMGKKEIDSIRARLDDIAFRLQFIENYLGIAKKEVAEGEGDQGEEMQKAEGDREKEYSEALKTFKTGKYAEAREMFQKFLKSFPDTEYSDNAQFWIGECYYFEGQYEKAILEYEKVVQNYPKGNKVADALLKQAFSFLDLGDRASAKVLLQRIINDYPNTTSARRAREKLVSIKNN